MLVQRYEIRGKTLPSDVTSMQLFHRLVIERSSCCVPPMKSFSFTPEDSEVRYVDEKAVDINLGGNVYCMQFDNLGRRSGLVGF